MSLSIPSKQECAYTVEMLESDLINSSYTQPWAERIIDGLEMAPPWLGDVATKRYRGDQIKALEQYLYSEPFVDLCRDELEKFRVACLWLRYERRELSWATFLRMAGEYLDAANGNWACEVPYRYLTVHENDYFSPESELETKEAFLRELDLAPWIMLAKEKFETFHQLRKTAEVNPD